MHSDATPVAPSPTVTTSVRRSIARVSILQGGEEVGHGTGFLIQPSVVLTAYHVVANRHVEGVELHGAITVTFPQCEPLDAKLDPELYDKDEDWALLRCSTPEGLEPLRAAMKVERGAEWQSYGFPEANSRDGLAVSGTVEDHRAQLEGIAALQLFSPQAAAGKGAPVKGLSGGPVLVENAVVGLMRFALMQEGKAVAGTLYSCPISVVARRIPELLSKEVPLQVRGFRVQQKLGEGGMGEVWLAEQREPVRRKVALKVIKWGLDSKEVIGRFESERQALALMSHEGIAKILDAGTTDQGRPYFVMEHVPGVPITEYCNRHQLGIHKRLDLFQQVCRAIHHAHQRGIIHRDIKPTNVLVQQVEGEPRCKVIDFGIAKATHQRLTEKTVFTQQGLMLGTPSYMSPEQADLDQLDIDTTSDVYSLGVLLYELLTGLLPFDAQRLREAGYSEMQRILREEQPPNPSTKVSKANRDSAAAGEGVASSHPNAGELVSSLRGDLDWITLKALEKDRTRRYSSASEFGDDIRRHLEFRPVIASPPSRVYRAHRFIQRHRVGVVATAVMLLALVGGAALALWQAARARAAEANALEEAATAEQVTDFLVELFEVSDPSEALGNTITAREVLDQGAMRIRQELGGQPEVQARLMATMGDVYWGLGLYEESEDLLKEALEINRELYGESHANTLDSIEILANLYSERARFLEAESLYLDALEASRQDLGDEHPSTLDSIHSLAAFYQDQERHSESEALYLQALETSRRVLGKEHPETIGLVTSLSVLYTFQGRLNDAEPLFLEVLEVNRRVLGKEHPDTFGAINNLAILYFEQGRFAEAESLFLETVESSRRSFGSDHPEATHWVNILAIFYDRQGRYAEAEPLYLAVLEVSRRIYGNEHIDTLTLMSNLALSYSEAGRFNEAKALLLEVIEIQRRVFGNEHPRTLTLIFNLAQVHNRDGRYSEAEPPHIEALEGRRRVLGNDHSDTLDSIKQLAIIRSRLGRHIEAKPLYLEARDSGTEDGQRWADFGDGCQAAAEGRDEEALGFLREAADILDKELISLPCFDPLRGVPQFQVIVAARDESQQ